MSGDARNLVDTDTIIQAVRDALVYVADHINLADQDEKALSDALERIRDTVDNVHVNTSELLNSLVESLRARTES